MCLYRYEHLSFLVLGSVSNSTLLVCPFLWKSFSSTYKNVLHAKYQNDDLVFLSLKSWYAVPVVIVATESNLIIYRHGVQLQMMLDVVLNYDRLLIFSCERMILVLF